MDSRIPPEELTRAGVTVHIPASLRTYTDGQDEVILEGPDVAELLRRLDEAFPGIRERVVDETGAPRPYVNLFVNDELVREPFPQVRLSPGDVIHILPSVAGGTLG
jgi:molybdopterin synthase sulfur carrier subunit